MRDHSRVPRVTALRGAVQQYSRTYSVHPDFETRSSMVRTIGYLESRHVSVSRASRVTPPLEMEGEEYTKAITTFVEFGMAAFQRIQVSFTRVYRKGWTLLLATETNE